jgi:HEAT repeat protein
LASKSSKKKPGGDDDELFPDTGAKPAKKPTKKVEKPVETPKKTETKRVEPKKIETKRVPKRVEKADKDEPVRAAKPAAEPSAPSVPAPRAPRGIKIAVAGIALVAAGGAAVAVVFNSGEEPQKPRPVPKIAVKVEQPKPRTVPIIRPSDHPVAALPPKVGGAPAVAATKPLPAAPLRTKGKFSLKELAERSANHAAIARILELYESVKKVDFNTDDRLFQDYQSKKKREDELLEQIRAIGPAGIDALKDMITNLDDDASRILLARALAGEKDQAALDAVADLMKNLHDIQIQTTLIRSLPKSPEATKAIAAAFADEPNANVRAMLLREYNTRLADLPPDPNNPGAANAALDPFRQAALNDPDPNVRAEAVAILGRKGSPSDMLIMQQIAQNETNTQIRQQAIVAYATTGQDSSLDFLDSLATNPDSSLEIRASCVLAIARVGNDRAIAMLDQIAQSDPAPAIQSRAQGFATGLRNRQQGGGAAAPGRIPVNPQPVPLNGN